MLSCTCRHPQDTALPTAGTSNWLAAPYPPQNNSSQKDHSKQPTEGKNWGILLLELPHFPLPEKILLDCHPRLMPAVAATLGSG